MQRNAPVVCSLSHSPAMAHTLLIGIGNDMRGDDGAGLLVARLAQACAPPHLTIVQQSGEGSALVEAWRGYDDVIVVDAATSGATPGTIHSFDAGDAPLPACFASNLSSHAFGLAGAVELARRLDCLPARLVVYGIEAHSFQHGAPLSPAVQTAARSLARRLTAPLKADTD